MGEDLLEEIGEEALETFLGFGPHLLLAGILGGRDEVAAVGHDEEDVFETLGDGLLLIFG